MAPSGLLAGLALLGASPPWQPVLKEEGVTVEKRAIEGSSLVEFRARGRVNASILATTAVIRASDRADEWMENCNGSAVLEWISATRWISYNRTKAPAFFVSDRDVVLENVLTAFPERRTIEVRFESVSHRRAPPIEGVVRMPRLSGYWRLLRVDKDTTEVEYQVRADPGGGLPHWMVNWASEGLPVKTLIGLREQVKASGYEAHRAVLEAAIDFEELEPPSREAARERS